jgi:hypothetical protein
MVLTVFFNYTVLVIWYLDYAEEMSERRWFTRDWMKPVDDPE